jgi:DNA-damage-inducible protein D
MAMGLPRRAVHRLRRSAHHPCELHCDRALFGGHDTQQMKDKLGVPQNRPLADFLPTITIKAKDFANEITTFNIERNQLSMEAGITKEHVKNNREVRQILVEKNQIYPENLPPAEDVKKIERRHESETKKLRKNKGGK